MFKRLESKIKRVLFLFISSFVILSFIIVYLIIKNNIFDNIIEFSLQNIAQRNQNVELYMDYMEETTKLVSTNFKILDELKYDAKSEFISSKLDFLKGTSIDIQGITIYDNYGRIYSTRNKDVVPSIEQILADADEETFNEEHFSFWIYRKNLTDDMISYWENLRYGVFSYISRIVDEDGDSLGYIMVDTKVQTIYNYYVTDSGELFRNTDTYIMSSDNQMYAAPYNSQNNEINSELVRKVAARNGYLLVDKKRRIITVSPLKDSNDVIIVCMPTNISDKLMILRIAFLSFAALLITAAYFGVTLISDSIIKPLTSLYDRMSNEHKGTLK